MWTQTPQRFINPRRWQLYGLDAISASNGWAISVVGISIVFTGLVSLSAVISQLHKLVNLFENPGKIKAMFASKPAKETGEGMVGAGEKELPVLTEAQKQVCHQYALLAGTMDDVLSLPGLLHRAELSGLKDPHANISVLLKAGILEADGNGYYCWDQDRFSRVVC